MKNSYLTSFLFLVLFASGLNSARGQNYVISPDDTLIATAPYNDLTIFDIFMQNTANNKISLSWTTISSNIPTGWDYSLCDLGTCYPGLPAGATMDSVNVGGQGFLGLNINPYALPGTATVRIYVYETGNQANGDTLTWIINSAPTNINEVTLESLVSIYPNPAIDMINIGMTSTDRQIAFVELYTITGKKLIQRSIAGGISEVMDISAYPAGVYFIRLISEDGAFADKKLIKTTN
jgi:hypothetical protein